VDLLGSTSVADDKTEQGVCLDVIGYTINLTDKRVLSAKKNFLRALHGYMGGETSGGRNPDIVNGRRRSPTIFGAAHFSSSGYEQSSVCLMVASHP
jgi:hypothetical protein